MKYHLHDRRVNKYINVVILIWMFCEGWRYKIMHHVVGRSAELPDLLNAINISLSMKREDQQVATIRCLLLTSVSTRVGHHHAHLQENNGPFTAFGVFVWFCWMWLVAVVGLCLLGCDHYEGFCSSHPTRQRPTTATNHIQQNQNNTPNAITGSLFSWIWA